MQSIQATLPITSPPPSFVPKGLLVGQGRAEEESGIVRLAARLRRIKAAQVQSPLKPQPEQSSTWLKTVHKKNKTRMQHLTFPYGHRTTR